MKTLMFEGSSDDTFGYAVKDTPSEGDDHDNCANGTPIQWRIYSPSQDVAMLVVGHYCPGAATGWLIGVARIDEDDDKPLPSWVMGFARGRKPYSPRLLIEVPDDVTVTHVPFKRVC